MYASQGFIANENSMLSSFNVEKKDGGFLFGLFPLFKSQLGEKDHCHLKL